jgi:hypothetical protein
MILSPDRTWISRLVGIGLALLVPGQVLAHCGILLPERHVHEHHATAAPAETARGGSTAQVSPNPGDVACSLGEAVFIAPRSLEQVTHAWLVALPGDVSLQRLPAFAVVPVLTDGKVNSARFEDLTIPLRI